MHAEGPNPKRIQAGGIVLHAESFGDPAHPAVLLIMGAMSSGVWWPEEFCHQLAARGRFVVRYDHRDTGESTSSPAGQLTYRFEDLADDGMRVLDGYGVQAAHLVGMSLGGYLSQLLALKYPGRVLTLALIASGPLAASDPGIPGMDPAIGAYHARAATLDWRDRAAVIEYQVGSWRLLAGSRHPFDADLVASMAAADFDRTPDPRSAFNHAALRAEEGWTNRLHEIRVPVLVIHGTEDPVLRYAHALALERALAGARLLTLPGTGHELPRRDWAEVLDALEQHTSRTASR